MRPFEPTISDPESRELAWVPVHEVDERPLHPGFARSWQRLRDVLFTRPAIVVDVANVVGSVPDGWWRDRAGSAERLLERIDRLAARGIAASELDQPEDVWFPEWTVVLEGAAKAADPARRELEIVRAEASGDDAIVAETRRLVASGRTVTVVTSDRELVSRAVDAGASARGARWLLDLL